MLADIFNGLVEEMKEDNKEFEDYCADLNGEVKG